MLCIKKEMKLNSPDSVISMVFPLDATADADLSRSTEKLVEDAKGETTNFDDTARILDYIPGLWSRNLHSGSCALLDYFGLLPMKLKRISPFHGSLFITSMASLGLPPIYHHIYNFGNVPVFVAFGITERKHAAQARRQHRIQEGHGLHAGDGRAHLRRLLLRLRLPAVQRHPAQTRGSSTKRRRRSSRTWTELECVSEIS